MSQPVTIKGRLTRDPELTFAKSGTAIAKFAVATSRRVKDTASGEWEDKDTSFWDITAFGEFAENICESLEKGTAVIVMGQMRQESWEKEGEKRTAWKVVADDVAVSCRWAKVEATRTGGRSAAPKTTYQDEEPPF